MFLFDITAMLIKTSLLINPVRNHKITASRDLFSSPLGSVNNQILRSNYFQQNVLRLRLQLYILRLFQ